MRRESLEPRADWREQMDEIGFTYHSLGGTYWDESHCYVFSEAEIDDLEAATAELHARSLDAARHVVRQGRWEEFGVPAPWRDMVAASLAAFEEGSPAGASILGRMDLVFDGQGPARLLEYNADTPTGCLEAAVAQWNWLGQVRPGADQFNSLHEKLIAAWQGLRGVSAARRLHFASVPREQSEEDWGNLHYLRDTAAQAGWDTRALDISRIGHDGVGFVDEESEPVSALFKLYPWEWLGAESFGALIPSSGTTFLEPPWKMLLSNKSILVVLWELFPGHPNLLPAYDEPSRLGERYARKPRLGREGANVTLVDGEERATSPGPYDGGGVVYQALAPLPRFEDESVLVGSWIANGQPAGIGLRVDPGPITGNNSRFVPHYFR